MKNSLFTFMAECISFLAVTTGAHAQIAGNVALLDSKKDAVKIYEPITSEKVNNVNLNYISDKAVKNFKKSYKLASDENWFVAKDGFAAKFTSNGINNVIYYDKKGRWQATIKIYGEDKISHNLRNMIKSVYSDYKINGVQEIETLISPLGIPTYIVYIQDGNNFKIIRVSDDVMDVYQEFRSNN